LKSANFYSGYDW